ncbi:MAG: hypothetical protein GWP50_05010 [Proteobacteria bacterium]|nr:hypothetical protein [Pseudomonadota bacterium]
MSYRSLLKKYIQHVEMLSGKPWLYQHETNSPLSRRDLMELRMLYDEMQEECASDDSASQDFNAITVHLCAMRGLNAVGLAERLAWPEHIVKRWLLDRDHPSHKTMTLRDFQHLKFCLLQHDGNHDHAIK